jgi:putative endonuclease
MTMRPRRSGAVPLSNWNVYVLMNGAGITYTGIAINVEARLAQHNAGIGARFTRGRGPWRILHAEGPLSHGDALRREAAIKRDRAFKTALKERMHASR